MKSLYEIKKLMALDKVSQAEAALKEVLQREPDNLQAKMLYGLCRQLSGDEEAFKRIYNEVAPKMEQASQPEQPPETVSLWKKYRTLWKSLIVGGLVLAGTAVAVVYFGRPVNQQVVSATPAMAAYGGPSYYGNVKQPGYESKSVIAERGGHIHGTSEAAATRTESHVKALVHGVRGKNRELVSAALANGADPNGSIEQNITPLGAAVDGLVIPDIEILRLLLEAGADPNRQWGNCGTTPFYSLVQSSCWGKKSPKELSSYSEDIRLMIRHGADPNRKQGAFGHSPLSYAVMRGADLSLIKILVEEGHGVVTDKIIEGSKNEAVKEYLQGYKKGESK